MPGIAAIITSGSRFGTAFSALTGGTGGSGCSFATCLSPQLFWFRWCRHNVLVVFFVCMCVNAGMWFERFIIIAGGLVRDFLPSSWRVYHPTWVDIWTYIGTIGIFTSLFLLFIRFPPDDRDVGSEDGHTRGGPALWRVAGNRNRFPGVERSARDDQDSVRSQGLCHGSGVSERRCALRSRKARARCWLPAMGRVFAISDSRNGRRDGDRQIVAERLGSVWRNFGIPYRGAGRIWPVIDSLPAHVHGKPTEVSSPFQRFSRSCSSSRCFSPHFRRSLRGKS